MSMMRARRCLLVLVIALAACSREAPPASMGFGGAESAVMRAQAAMGDAVAEPAPEPAAMLAYEHNASIELEADQIASDNLGSAAADLAGQSLCRVRRQHHDAAAIGLDHAARPPLGDWCRHGAAASAAGRSFAAATRTHVDEKAGPVAGAPCVPPGWTRRDIRTTGGGCES